MKRRLAILLSIVLIGVCACDKVDLGTLKNDNGNTGVAELTGEEASNIAVDEGEAAMEMSKFEEAVAKYITNPDDAVYFAPASDDYIYVINKESNGTNINIFSFDDSGEIIQSMCRVEYNEENFDGDYSDYPYVKISSDHRVQYNDFYAENPEAWKDDSVYQNVTHKIRKIYRELLNCRYEGNKTVVMSKDLTGDDFAYTNETDHPALDQLKGVAEDYGSDYCISVAREKEEHKAGLHYGVVYDHGVMHEAFAMYRATIYIFNDDGVVTKMIEAVVLDSSDQIEEYKKFHFGTKHNDDYSEITVDEENWEKEGIKKMNIKQKGTALYGDYNGSNLSNLQGFGDRKWHHILEWGNSESSVYYLSIPKLTDSQLNKFLKEMNY